jgi:hypothetical protein
VLFSLHHVIDLEWMLKAYRLTREDGATGIDGVWHSSTLPVLPACRRQGVGWQWKSLWQRRSDAQP